MLSLVIPTYNERHNITPLIHRAEQVLSRGMYHYEIIIVDDDSPDGTWQVAQEIAQTNSHLVVLRRVAARGLATAVIDGWRLAKGDALGVMDGDLQHPPEILPKLLDPVLRGDVDIAVGSRHTPGGGMREWSTVRRFISRAGKGLANLMLPQFLRVIRDPMSGFFVMKRSVIDAVLLKPPGYKILLEVLAKGKYRRVVEVPYVFVARKKGESKLGPRQYMEFLRHLTLLARKA